MRALVTGSRGLIGSHVVRVMREFGHHVVEADRKVPSFVYRKDLSTLNVNAMIRGSRPDVVVHLAASPGRAFAEQWPRPALLDGIVATTIVAQGCARYGVKMAYASSSEVYGDHGAALVDERTPTSPTSGLYGMTKAWGEQVCEHYLAVEKLLVLRPLMVYGPGQRVGEGWAALPSFIDSAIKGKRITVHEGARRSWCYVSDVANAICGLLEDDRTFVYNVGRDDEEVSMLDVAELACDLAGASRDLIDVVEPPPLQTVVKRVSCARLYATGWRPRVSLEQGMQIVYEHLSSSA